jgi:glycogen debranching enzyme
MAFKVQVGPAHIAIHQGQTVLLTETDGWVNWPKGGLYFRDTRVISAWAIFANGERWDLLNGGAVAPQAARNFLTNRSFATEDGPVAARTLGLEIGRQIDGGLHEDIDITNNSQKPVRFNLEVAMRADFADIFEVKGENIVRRGHITTGRPRRKYFGLPIAIRISAGKWSFAPATATASRRYTPTDA